MKLIMRVDDVGYTKAHNMGTFETIENGVATAADVMLDTPGTEDALERLRSYPWISIGWHNHFWGSPVLDAEQVPSLIIKEVGRIRFRKDIHKAEDVVYEEILMEMRAQIDRCIRILGKAPDIGGGAHFSSPFGRASMQVCNEYGIATNFIKSGFLGNPPRVDERWANRNIYMADQFEDYRTLLSANTITELDNFDPAASLYGNPKLQQYQEEDYVVSAWHPGYIDPYVYHLGDHSPEASHFILVRLQDVEALCSERMKNWIKENHLELSNFRDALYGTKEYQNHLKAVGSDLAIR